MNNVGRDGRGLVAGESGVVAVVRQWPRRISQTGDPLNLPMSGEYYL